MNAQITARLAHFVCETTAEAALDGDNTTWARHAVLDWLGVTLAAQDEPVVDVLVKEVLERRSQSELARHRVVGRDMRTDLLDAVMINGAASHALDYDDVNPCLGGHPGVVTIPVALALAELNPHITGREFLAAIVVGYEVGGAIGQMLGTSHYARGFHNTGTIGTFAATAVAAWLLRLDQRTTKIAFGLAASQAAGLKCAFGTMTKPFHAGAAAKNGLMSARLAACGMTANPTALEATNGFAAAQAPEFDPRAWVAPARGSNDSWVIANTLFKYHAACFGTHSILTAIANLKAREAFDIDDIERVVLIAPERSRGQCDIQDPTTGLQIKFSTQHLAAMALIGTDTASPESYSDSAAADARAVSLRNRVTLEFDPIRSRYIGDATVVLRSGRQLTAQANVGKPATDLADQWARLSAKFKMLASPHLTLKGAERCAELVATLTATDCLSDLFDSV
ncbi:MAG: MmgE/PrpD family protein [Pseudomonadota bacterium]